MFDSATSARLSPDGQFWWDGTRWQRLSPDGRTYWDGQAWQPTGWSRPIVHRSPTRRRAAWVWVLSIIGLVMVGAGAFLTATNLPNVPDAVSFLTAHQCARGESGQCYSEEAATVTGIDSQVGLDPDQSMNTCVYRMKFDHGTTNTFGANCAAFSPGDRVTGRFWKGRLELVTDQQGDVYSDNGAVGSIVAASVGAILIAIGLVAGVAAWRLLRWRRGLQSAI